jgi:DNA-binding Lrp family transcriptional regulator
MKAYVLVTTKSGTAEKVAETIRKVKSVSSAECVYGRFDVILIIDTPVMETINSVVHIIERLPEVLHTETALTHYMEDYSSEKLKSKGIIQ